MKPVWGLTCGMVMAALISGAAAAVTCTEVAFDGAQFTTCEVSTETDDLRLFLRDEDGAIFGSFSRVAQSLPEGQTLGIAMNAGMYHEDRSPVGLYVENGEQEMRVITSEGPGNFGLLPNGVFCLFDDRAMVIESRAYAADPPACRHATQSGPMLVIDGALHPRFLPNSNSFNIRNGVGVDDTGTRVVLAISDQPVTFHHFARLFRDMLDLPNALFLDGRVSRLYAPEMGRNDFGFAIGPILGTVVDEASADR